MRGAVLIPTEGASPVTAPNLYPGGSGNATGDVLKGAVHPYGYDPFGLSITAGYRFMPAFSVGAFFEYASFQAIQGTDTGDYVDGTSQLQRRALQGGVYGRYYLTMLSPSLHPWVELGIGYNYDTSSYTRGSAQGAQGQPVTTNYYLTYQGLTTNLRLGLDWRLSPIFSVGPVVGYGRSFALGACVDAEPQTDQFNGTQLAAKSTCDSGTVQGNDYGVFFGGIFAKVTLGPDVR